MPRLPWTEVIRAYNESSLLPVLLPACRSLPAARNELRWLREHAISSGNGASSTSKAWRTLLHDLCRERGRGKPLQYILGDQPFGDLSIKCRPGVLIPRPETEAYVYHLAEVIKSRRFPHLKAGKNQESSLKILDLCTGTGCIPLLLHALLSEQYPVLRLLGVDISSTAIALSQNNLARNVRSGSLKTSARHHVQFKRANVLNGSGAGLHDLGQPQRLLQMIREGQLGSQWDVIISNPPYISPRSFQTTTARSVRNWEPKDALVPMPAPPVSPTVKLKPQKESNGDTFYPDLLEIAVKADARLGLFEVADMEQAIRVAALASQSYWDSVEIWCDWPTQPGSGVLENEEFHILNGRKVRVLGQGHGRSVVCRKVERANPGSRNE